MEQWQLSENEKTEIANKAIAKAQEARRQEYEHKEKERAYKKMLEDLMRPWIADEYMDYAKRVCKQNAGRELIIDEHNRELINLLCLYFSNNPTFERDGRSLKKGLAIYGSIGSGKTFSLKLFANNQRQSFRVFPVHKICDVVGDEGNELIYQYAQPQAFIPATPENFMQSKYGRLFDDLGAENRGKNDFGGRDRIMREIITTIYESDVPYYYFHLTFNLNLDQIKRVYGDRVFSRMKAMFNFIPLDGEDRRG